MMGARIRFVSTLNSRGSKFSRENGTWSDLRIRANPAPVSGKLDCYHLSFVFKRGHLTIIQSRSVSQSPYLMEPLAYNSSPPTGETNWTTTVLNSPI